MPLNPYQPRTVVIEAGTHYSSRADLRGMLYVEKIELPAGWDAASLTFQQRVNGTWRNVADEDGEYEVAGAGAGRIIVLWDDKLIGDGVFRLRSGTTAAPVDQSAQRVIRLHVRRL